MGSSRGTDRVTTVVAAIFIGAALTGTTVALADPDKDSPSGQSELIQRCEFPFSLRGFVGLARLPTFVALVRLT